MSLRFFLRRQLLRRQFIRRQVHPAVGLLARFAGDPRGMSAVEFAMILPLMITLYLGTVEVSQGISIDRKVTLTARTAADLISQWPRNTMAVNDFQDRMTGAQRVMGPYPTDSSVFNVKISEIDVDASGNPTFRWSRALYGNGNTGTPTLPAALRVPGANYIFSEVTYKYKPTVGYVITGQLNLSDTMYMRLRRATSIDID